MSNQFLDTIDRLSKKRGVIATLILDRQNTGSIIKSSSSPAFSRLFISKEGFEGVVNRIEDDERNMKDLAGMVWNHVESTEQLVGALDPADEAKFLRLRTRKFELVIVPDPKYVLVVVHETPPA